MTVQIHSIEQTFLKPCIVMVEELDYFSSDVFFCFLACFAFAAKLIWCIKAHLPPNLRVLALEAMNKKAMTGAIL